MTAGSELAGLIAKFTDQMQDRIRGCRAKLRERFPDAVEMIYDNYNFLVLGFGPTDRPSEAILSLAAHARGVILCFLQRGPELPDPTAILRGSGKVVRNVILSEPDDLEQPRRQRAHRRCPRACRQADERFDGEGSDHQVDLGKAAATSLIVRRARNPPGCAQASTSG